MKKTSVRPAKPFWQEWNLIRAFGQRDLKSKFNGTILGWLWSLVVPLASLGIYTLIFGGLFKMVPVQIAFRHEGIGIFAVWLFAGLTIWSFFQNCVNGGINGLLGTGGLLQKVYFPAYSAVLGSCLAVAVQSAVEVGLLLVVLLLLGNISFTWLLLIPFIALLLAFTGAVSVILSIWNIYIRDLAHLVGVFLQLMFYATPIIYNADLVPETLWGLPARTIVGAMPMAEFIDLFRSLVYSLEAGSITDWLMCCAWTGGALLVATWVFRRWGADLGERI